MTSKKGYCLILEGGGAKTAYGVGVLSYLEEQGYQYCAIAGASFGALNGALYLEGGIKRLYDFYNNFESSDIYLDQEMERIVNEYDGNNSLLISLMSKLPSSTTKRKEMSDNFHQFIISSINEEKIRKSKIDFVFPITYAPSMKNVLYDFVSNMTSGKSVMKTMGDAFGSEGGEYVDIKNIPEGCLSQYIAATTNYPVFEPILINGNPYIDGGCYNNTPYQPMLERGYNKFIIIRANPSPSLDSFIENNPNNLIFTPSSSLGSAATFTRANFMALMARGYQDAKEYLKNKNK